MPRGGKRKGAGAKPKWKHGKTTSIRVPAILKDEILDYARQLDDGAIGTQGDGVINLSGVNLFVVRGQKAVLLSDLLKSGHEIYPTALADSLRKKLLFV